MFKLFIFMLFTSLSFISHATASTITAGTTIKARLAEPIDSRLRSTGYRFRLTVDSDITQHEKVLIKSGSKAQAIITQIKRSGKGLAPPTIIVALTMVNINNRAVNVTSFQTAGKGNSNERKQLGESDINENWVLDRHGEKISTAIPVISKGYDLLINEGTVIYFILKEPLSL